MALTGLGLLGFLLAHLTGNLLVFSGADAINEYAGWIQDHPKLIWAMRLGLIGIFVLHIALAMRLTNENKSARPTRYQIDATVKATFASRYMLMTGILVLAYVVYHLLHFTFHTIDTGSMGLKDAAGHPDVYSMMMASFTNPLVSLSYIVANLILGLHLWHGLGSAIQTMGWNNPAFRSVATPVLRALPILIAGGYIAIPVAIWTGVIS